MQPIESGFTPEVRDEESALAHWAKDRSASLFMTRAQNGTIVISSKPKMTWIQKIFSRFFPSLKKSSEKYSCLRETMCSLIKQVKATVDERERAKKKEGIGAIFQRIREEYIHLANQPHTLETMRQKNDLLEAFCIGLKEQGSTPNFFLHTISRIRSEEVLAAKVHVVQGAAQLPLKKVQDFSEHLIMIVEFEKIQEATKKLIQAESGRRLTQQDIATALEGIMQIEEAPAANILKLLYAHRFPGQNLINQVTTYIAGLKYGSNKKITDIAATIEFFHSMHIRLETEINGELYSFSESFGYQIGEGKTLNESFGRALTSERIHELLTHYTTLRDEVQRFMQFPLAQVISADAFSRTRLFQVQAGELQKPFPIIGKVVQDTPENRDVAAKEVSTDRHSPPSQARYQFSVAALLGEGINPEDQPDENAQRDLALLGHLRGFLQTNDCTMVVQRLAPEDIHTFQQTASGVSLRRDQWCEELLRLLPESERVPLESVMRSYKKEQREKKSEEEHEHDLSRTIDIQGATTASVSPIALRHQPEILAQNDRKIMLCKNRDGSLAIQVFIGATGVNQVAVTKHQGRKKAGAELGWMGFGPGKNKKSSIRSRASAFSRIWNALFRRTPTDSITVQEKTFESGVQQEVQFGLGGSTVISIYLNKDYMVRPQVQQFLETAQFQNPQHPERSEAIEIRTRPGDVLLIPAFFPTAKLLYDHGLAPLKKTDEYEAVFQMFKAGIEQDWHEEGPLSNTQEEWKTIFRKITPQYATYTTAGDCPGLTPVEKQRLQQLDLFLRNCKDHGYVATRTPMSRPERVELEDEFPSSTVPSPALGQRATSLRGEGTRPASNPIVAGRTRSGRGFQRY